MLPQWANETALLHAITSYEEKGIMNQHPDQKELYECLDPTYIDHLHRKRPLNATFIGQDLACVTLLLSACTPADTEVLDAVLATNAATAHTVGNYSSRLG